MVCLLFNICIEVSFFKEMRKIAGVITFVEEALPGFDVIPTFTLMWIYTYVFNSEKKTKK